MGPGQELHSARGFQFGILGQGSPLFSDSNRLIVSSCQPPVWGHLTPVQRNGARKCLGSTQSEQTNTVGKDLSWKDKY